jgi:hypothetical protein
MTAERERELIELAGRAFEAGYTESQVVALIEAESDVVSEDQAVEMGII